MHLNGTDGKSLKPAVTIRQLIFHPLLDLCKANKYSCVLFLAELVEAVRYFDQRQTQAQQQTQDQSEEVRDSLAFLELQAQVSL